MVCNARSLEVDVIGISIQAKRSRMVALLIKDDKDKVAPLLGRNKISRPSHSFNPAIAAHSLGLRY
jgi:hypothetical protein